MYNNSSAMELKDMLSDFYGNCNVLKTGCIYYVYPTRDAMGIIQEQKNVSEVMSELSGFAEINNLTLDKLEKSGANVYNSKKKFIGTIIIRYF